MHGGGGDLDAVLAHLDPMRARPGVRVVLVRGPAGLGKSTLVRTAARVAGDRGVPVLFGRADEVDARVPFGVLRDVLRGVDSAGLSPAGLGLLARLRQVLDEVSGPTADQVWRAAGEVLRPVAALLREATRVGPVVLVLDDLHVADIHSMSLLCMLVRHISHLPVLVVTALRPGWDDATTELRRLVDRLVTDRRGAVVDLEPLAPADVRRLVDRVLGQTASRSLVDHVMAQSRGNPLLAQAMASQILAQRAFIVRDGTAELTALEPGWLSGYPQQLAQLLPRDPAALRLARVLAVLGPVSVAELALVAELTAEPPLVLADGISRLVSQGLLELRGAHGYDFLHPPVKDALYAGLGDADRHQLHRAIADRLDQHRREGAGVDLFELARHATAGYEIGDDRAWRIAVEAATAALPQAPSVAARWYARALDCLPPSRPERAMVRAELVFAGLLGAADEPSVESVAEALTGLAPSAIRSELAFRAAHALADQGRLSRAVEVVEAEVADGRPLRSLVALHLHLLAQAGRPEAARRRQGDLDRTARADEQPSAALAGELQLMRYGLLTAQPDLLARAHDRARALVPAVPTAAQAEALRVMALTALLGPGPFDVVRADLAAARRLPDGNHEGAAGALATLLLAWLEGQWDDALRVAHGALQRSAGADLAVVGPAVRAVVALIRCDRGDPARARSMLGDVVARDAFARPLVVVANARLLRLDGHGRAAGEILSNALPDSPDGGSYALVSLLTEELVAVELARGRAGEAARAAHFGAGLVGSLDWPMLTVPAHRALAAATGDLDAARAAAATAAAQSAGAELARCWLTLAELGDEPDRNAARAWQAFHDLEAAPLRARAARVLRRSGGRPPTIPRPAGGPGSGRLTTVESAVVRLVASGLTNRQIAEQLSYSVKTVEAHLTRIYAKTGSRGRFDLAAQVVTGRLVDP